jgi:hypothetical protein
MPYSIQNLKLIKVFYNISKLSAQIIKLRVQAVNGIAHLQQINISTYLFMFCCRCHILTHKQFALGIIAMFMPQQRPKSPL